MKGSKSLSDMMQMWSTTQQQIWSSWVETTQGIGRAPTPDLRGKIIATWEQSVRQTLNAQAEWLQAWMESAKNMQGMPENARDWLTQGQQGLQQWHAAQRQLWERLFDMLRQAAPDTTPRTLEQASGEIFQAWQDAARQILENQLQWVSAWTRKDNGSA